MSVIVRTLSVMALLGGMMFSVPALAQESGSGSMSGSGATPPPPPPLTLRERATIVAGLQGNGQATRSLLMLTQEKIESLQKERMDGRLRMRQHLQDCHDGVRRANRDQMFPTTLQCFRGRLMLELTWLRREQKFLSEDKSVRPEIQKEAFDATDALIEGISAIVTGIDSGVYTDEAGLREAKTLLHSQYRLRTWAAVLRADADRMLSWISLLARDAGAYLVLTEGVEPHPWETSVSCLENAASWLQQAKSATTYDDVLAAWSMSRSEAANCVTLVRKAAKTKVVTDSGGMMP